MMESYLAERVDTDTKIENKTRELAMALDPPSPTWASRMRVEAAVALGVLSARHDRQSQTVVIERQKPWAKLELRLEGYQSGYAHKTHTFRLLAAEPTFLLEEIEKDRLIQAALLKIVDDGRLEGSERHFGGQVSKMAVGEVFTVKVYTD